MHSVFCRLKDESLVFETWSHVFFLLRNHDLSLCLINDLHYCFDWMCLLHTKCHQFLLQCSRSEGHPRGFSAMPVLLANCCNLIWVLLTKPAFYQEQLRDGWSSHGAGGQTRWHLKVIFKICGGLMVLWQVPFQLNCFFFFRQAADYGKPVYSV